MRHNTVFLIFVIAISALDGAVSKTYDHIPSYKDKTGTEPKQCEPHLVPPPEKTLACDKSEDEIKKDKYEANEKPGLDRDLTSYTGWITLLTFGMLAAAVVQAGFFWWQLRLMRATIDDTNKAFVLSQRPRIRVRNVVVDDKRANKQRCDIFEEGKIVSGQFYVSNVGGTPATITDSHCIVYWRREGLPMRRPYEGNPSNKPIGQIKLAPGESCPGIFASEELMNAHGQTAGGNVAGGLVVFVMGWIEYADDIGVRRRTAFCREYVKKNGWFDGKFETSFWFESRGDTILKETRSHAS